MATLLAKAYVIPVVVSHRPTCLGEQYTIETPGYVDIVTVNGSSITCACQSGECDHIRTVKRTRAVAEKQNTRRDVYTALFDLSYGDNCY